MEDTEFSPYLKETNISVSDWKRDEIVSDIQATINVLCDLWDIETETILSEDDPIEVNIYGQEAEIDNEGIKISDPDSYRTRMRNLFDDNQVIDAVDSHYPVPFNEVPEEVGQIIGECADNNWEYENDVVSRARDELHGAMAVTEFYPWYIDKELELLENNLSIIMDLDSEDHLEYLDQIQNGKLNRLKGRLEKISDQDNLNATCHNAMKTGILNEAQEILENSPETVHAPGYTHEESPEDFSEYILEDYLSLDELADCERIERVLNDESFRSIDDIKDNIENVEDFNYEELETLQNRINENINTKRDRAYIISRRFAKQIYREGYELTPTQIIHSTPENDTTLRETIYSIDKQIKSEYGI